MASVDMRERAIFAGAAIGSSPRRAVSERAGRAAARSDHFLRRAVLRVLVLLRAVELRPLALRVPLALLRAVELRLLALRVPLALLRAPDARVPLVFALAALFARPLAAPARLVERGFALSVAAAPARVAAALPACLTASPAAFAADFTPFAALFAALRASPAAARASFTWRVVAAFLPDDDDEAFCWLRFLVAAAFLAAAERSRWV